MKKVVDLERLKELLPHGSGIDCDWELERKGDYVYCQNSYHTMNEHGYYDKYADFTIKIPIDFPGDFKLMFNGKTAQYMNRKYMLRDYLEDTIFHNLNIYFHLTVSCA